MRSALALGENTKAANNAPVAIAIMIVRIGLTTLENFSGSAGRPGRPSAGISEKPISASELRCVPQNAQPSIELARRDIAAD